MENTVNTPENTQTVPMFTTRAGNDILAGTISKPVPPMLFSEFWSEGELAVLFGNSGAGKSLLAVQAADAISRGNPVNGFTTQTPAQKVLYFDFATSDRQFARRYEGYSFSDNFIRVTINPRHWDLRRFGEQLVAAIEAAVQENEARVVIIDSLSVLKFFVNEVYLLSHLLRLKDALGLSILLLAGAKKMQPGKPLWLGNLAANKMLAGIAHSIFALGETLPEGDLRYLVHLKGNEHGRVYHHNNVMTGRNAFVNGCGVQGVTGVLPGFEFMGYDREEEQLRREPEGLDAWILYTKLGQPELSLGAIARELNTNKTRVKRVLDRYYQPPGNTAVTHNLKFENSNSKSEIEPESTQQPTLTKTPSDPFTGDVEPSAHPSTPGVNAKNPGNTAVTAVTPNSKSENSNPKSESEPESTQQPTLTKTPSDPFTGNVEPSAHPSERGVNARKPEKTAVTAVTHNLKFENSNSKSDSEPESTQQPTLTKTPSDPFTGDVELLTHPSTPGVNARKPGNTAVTAVTHNSKPENSNSKSESEPESTQQPTLTKTPSDPFTGDVEPSAHSSERGVNARKPGNTAVTAVTPNLKSENSNSKSEREPKPTLQPTLTYSQRVKKQLAQARKAKRR